LRSSRRPPIRTGLVCAAAAAISLLLVQAGPAWAHTAAHPTHPKAAKAPAFHTDKTPLPADITHTGGGSTSTAPSVGSTSGMVVRTIVGLAIVLAVVYGLYWLLRSAAKSRSSQSDERIAVIATTALAQGRALHLVRSGDELILLGATEHSVTPIRVYSAVEAEQLELAVATQNQLPAKTRATPARRPATMGQALELLRQRTVRT
jgi:flagellar protein FliO/FliZ